MTDKSRRVHKPFDTFLEFTTGDAPWPMQPPSISTTQFTQLFTLWSKIEWKKPLDFGWPMADDADWQLITINLDTTSFARITGLLIGWYILFNLAKTQGSNDNSTPEQLLYLKHWANRISRANPMSAWTQSRKTPDEDGAPNARSTEDISNALELWSQKIPTACTSEPSEPTPLLCPHCRQNEPTRKNCQQSLSMLKTCPIHGSCPLLWSYVRRVDVELMQLPSCNIQNSNSCWSQWYNLGTDRATVGTNPEPPARCNNSRSSMFPLETW